MADLKELAKQITEARATARIEIDAVPYSIRGAVQNSIVDAKERLEKLEKEYATAIRRNSIGILLSGDASRQETVVEIAAEEAGTVTVRADDLYQRLATDIEPSLGNTNEFGSTQLSILRRSLTEVAGELGIAQMALPLMGDLYGVPDRATLVRYIRALVRTAVGDDLAKMYMDRAINAQASLQDFGAKTLPVVVPGLADGQEVDAVSTLFSKNSIVDVGTSSDGEVTKEFVLSSLTDVRKKLKK